MAPVAAAALLEGLADRALRSESEPVVCLQAPQAVEVPRSLLRADGRSVYQRSFGAGWGDDRCAMSSSRPSRSRGSRRPGAASAGRWRPAIHLVHRWPPGRYYPWMKVPSVSAGAFGEFAGRIGAITAGRPTDEVPGRGQEPGRCQVPRRS